MNWLSWQLTRNTLDCDQSNYSSGIVFSHIPIEYGQTGISVIQSADTENPILEPNTEQIGWSVAQISPFKFSKMAAELRLAYTDNYWKIFEFNTRIFT